MMCSSVFSVTKIIENKTLGKVMNHWFNSDEELVKIEL